MLSSKTKSGKLLSEPGLRTGSLQARGRRQRPRSPVQQEASTAPLQPGLPTPSPGEMLQAPSSPSFSISSCFRVSSQTGKRSWDSHFGGQSNPHPTGYRVRTAQPRQQSAPRVVSSLPLWVQPLPPPLTSPGQPLNCGTLGEARKGHKRGRLALPRPAGGAQAEGQQPCSPAAPPPQRVLTAGPHVHWLPVGVLP